MADEVIAQGQKRIGLSIPIQAARMIREALDSHIYWQMSDPQYRRDGFVMEPYSDNAESREEIAQAHVLIESIDRAIQMVGGDEPEADPPSASPPPEAGSDGAEESRTGTAILEDFLGLGEADAMKLLDTLADETVDVEIRNAFWRSMRFSTLHYFVSMAVSTSLLTNGNYPLRVGLLHAGAAAELDRRFPSTGSSISLAETFRTYIK